MISGEGATDFKIVSSERNSLVILIRIIKPSVVFEFDGQNLKTLHYIKVEDVNNVVTLKRLTDTYLIVLGKANYVYKVMGKQINFSLLL